MDCWKKEGQYFQKTTSRKAFRV